jgi:hypothetical protein
VPAHVRIGLRQALAPEPSRSAFFESQRMFSKQSSLAKTDPELFSAIQEENRRQEDHIELIASENYVSWPVMEAQGSQLTNKYAEG